MKSVITTERGWPGHFVGAAGCVFHRNTLIEYKDKKIVVSTIGRWLTEEYNFRRVGLDRYYETMAFHAKEADVKYNDVDVERIVPFESNWRYPEKDADIEANKGHDVVVAEIIEKLKLGVI